MPEKEGLKKNPAKDVSFPVKLKISLKTSTHFPKVRFDDKTWWLMLTKLVCPKCTDIKEFFAVLGPYKPKSPFRRP